MHDKQLSAKWVPLCSQLTNNENMSRLRSTILFKFGSPGQRTTVPQYKNMGGGKIFIHTEM